MQVMKVIGNGLSFFSSRSWPQRMNYKKLAKGCLRHYQREGDRTIKENGIDVESTLP